MARLAHVLLFAPVALLMACGEPTRVTSARPSPNAPPLRSPVVGDPLFTVLPPGDIECQDWLYTGFGISNTGFVAGFVQVLQTGGMFDSCTGRAAVWDPDGNVRILEPVGPDKDPFGTVAHDVDDAGNVVGASDEGFGVLWTVSGPAFALAPLPGDVWSSAAAISDVGQLIVGASGPAEQSSMRAVVWTGPGAPRALAPVSGPSGVLACSRAYTVNDRGDAAGYAWDCAGGPDYAVLWPRAGGAAVIADPQTRALDINEGGEILGYAREGRQFVWTPGADGVTGTLRQLPLPDGALHCDPLWLYDQIGIGGIDDFGNVVGICSEGGPSRLVVWTSEGGMTVLPPDAGFFMKVNDRGEIAGAGLNGFDAGIWRVPFAHPNRTPSANAGGPYAGSEGTPIAFDGRASLDPDREVLTYEWNFTGARDASGALVVEATGATPSYTYADNGNFTVTLGVVDARGARSTPVTAAVPVANARPGVMLSAAPLRVRSGAPIQLTGSFTDPGVNDFDWTIEVDLDLDDPRSKIERRAVGAGAQATPWTFPIAYTVTRKEGARTFRIQSWVTDKDLARGASNIVSVCVYATDPALCP